METYEVSHKIETVPLAGRKWKSKTNDDGVILRFYNWRFNLRKDPVYAVGFDGKDDYLSQFSRKEKGCVYIPLDVIRERDKFRIVTGKGANRKEYLFVKTNIVCVMDDPVRVEGTLTLLPARQSSKQVHPLFLDKPKETENAEATEVIEETETYIIREVRCA